MGVMVDPRVAHSFLPARYCRMHTSNTARDTHTWQTKSPESFTVFGPEGKQNLALECTYMYVCS